MSSTTIIDKETGLVNMQNFKKKYPYGHAIIKISEANHNLGEIILRGAGSPSAHKKIYDELYADKENYAFVLGELLENES